MQAVMIISVLETFFKSKIVQYVLLGIFVIFFVRWGLNKLLLLNPKDVSLPDKGRGVPQGWEPDGLVQELYDVLDGIFTFGSTKERVISKLYVLSDDQLVLVYNKFNDRFARKKDGSLYSWIQSEYWLSDNISAPILERMRNLKLI